MRHSKHIRFALAVLTLAILVSGSALAQNVSSSVEDVEDEEEILDDEEDYGERCSPEECETDSPQTPTTPTTQACSQDTWECGEWGQCNSSGARTRSCTRSFDCPSAQTQQPPTSDTCAITPLEENTTPVAPVLPQAPVITLSPEQRERQDIIQEATREVQTEISITTEQKLSEEIKDTTPAFQQIVASGGAARITRDANSDTDRDGINDNLDQDPLDADKNHNGIIDGVEQQLGQNPFRVDREDITLQAEVTVMTRKLLSEGLTQEEADKAQEETLTRRRTEKRVEKIRRAAKVPIESHEQDSNKDGVSDEVAISLGLNPLEEVADTSFPVAERKIYSANPSLVGKRCTMGLYSGFTLPAEGFSVLASCPSAQRSYTLYAIGEDGEEHALETRQASENNKLIFTVSGALRDPGSYVFVIRPTVNQAKIPFWKKIFSKKDIAYAAADESSEPVLVRISEKVDVTSPVAEEIQGVKIEGVSDIEVVASSDGRVRVSGKSDSSATVVGTFSSAIFTSAMLADIQSGTFSILSPSALPEGTHEVTLYATKPEEAVQSPPVRIKFDIIPQARAAAVYSAPDTDNYRIAPSKFIQAQKGRRQTAVWILSGLATVLIGLGIYTKNRHSKDDQE